MIKNKSNDIIVNPLVSIVIPSYNRIETIRETLDSILKQECDFDFEIIIGDDCSTDGVIDVLLDYKKRFPKIISLFSHKENIGLGANWASCINLCRGQYIAGCDNDDFWHNPDKLNLQVSFLDKNPDYGMVHTDYIELNRKTKVSKSRVIHGTQYQKNLIQEIFYGNFKCCNSSVMYRKSIIDKYVPLDDYIKYKFPLQDWNTWICIANFTKFHCLPVLTTTVGIEDGSITRPVNFNVLQQRLEKEKFMFQYVCDKFPDDLTFKEMEYDCYMYNVYLNHAFKHSDYRLAQNYGLKLIEAGMKDLKSKMSQSFLTFYLYSIFKKIKRKFSING